MRPMIEGLEGRTLLSATPVSSSALPTSLTPSVPVNIAGKTILPNTVFRGKLKLAHGGIKGKSDLPVTLTFASVNGFSYTATLSITSDQFFGTQVFSDAAPTDTFLVNHKLTNTLSAFTDSSGQANILFTNFIHPKDPSTGKFEAVEKVTAGFKGNFTPDAQTLSGTFNLTLKGNKTHGRTGTFSVTAT